MLKSVKFFYKLFIAFLLTGIIPIALISTVFAFLSGDIITGSYKQQSKITVERIVESLNRQLDKYRHTVYAMSEDPEIMTGLLENRHLERPDLLKLYQKMYTAISGNIDNVSLHIISLTDFPSLSTQQIPENYLNGGEEAAGGIFWLSSDQPQKTVTVFNNFTNARGDRVMMTFCKSITDARGEMLGFVVLDINKNPIAELCEKENNNFFNELFIVDPLNNLASDLNHDENDGNFSFLPSLSDIQLETAGQFNRGDRMIVHQPLDSGPFQVAGSVPMNIILSNLSYLIRITLWVILFSIFLSVLLAFLVSRSISKPVHQLAVAMGRVEEGDLSVRIKSSRDDEIGLLNKRFNIMTEQIHNLLDEMKEEQAQLRIAERKALQAQINPHFLYNTLNTIKSIAKLEGVGKITEIVTRLGKLLRNTIDSNREMVTLQESAELIEDYLAIQRIRFGDRLDFNIDIPESLNNFLLPKLILQPIVENAVIHGLEGKVGKGTISVTASVRQGTLLIEIVDDGEGMSRLWSSHDSPEDEGIGLSNVHKRLQLLFGNSAGLEISSSPGAGTTVRIVIPEIKEGMM